jgi:fibronectin-binding autotransporter adhesin
MKKSRFGVIGVALVLFAASILLIIGRPAVVSADNLYTCTWSGNGVNGLFSNPANWNGCNGAPLAIDDDTLVFSSLLLSQNTTLTNDIPNLKVYNLLFNGTNTSHYNYTIVPSSNESINLNHGITVNGTNAPTIDTDVSLSANQTFQGGGGILFGDANKSPVLNLGTYNLGIGSGSDSTYFRNNGGSINGSGAVTINNGAYFILGSNSASGWTSNITVNNGAYLTTIQNGLGSVANVSVQSGGQLSLCGFNGTNFSNNLNIAGTDALSSVISCGGGGAGGGVLLYDAKASVNLTGSLVLSANTTVSTVGTITVSGSLSGAYTLGLDSGGVGKLIISSSNNSSLTANGSYSSPLQVITIASGDNQPATQVLVGGNQEYIIDGVRGYTEVFNGGLLKGNGTVTGLQVDQGGTVSPGHSPGCITVNGSLHEGGAYQAEIGGTTACSGYDQLIVTSGNSVFLNDGGTPAVQGILQLSTVDGFIPSNGQTFEIINNQGSNPVNSTFSGYPEGTVITAGNYQFKISYKGGDGNDVVLSYVGKVAAPGAPNTGFGLVSSHYAVTLISTTLAAAGIYLIYRKLDSSKISKKRR